MRYPLLTLVSPPGTCGCREQAGRQAIFPAVRAEETDAESAAQRRFRAGTTSTRRRPSCSSPGIQLSAICASADFDPMVPALPLCLMWGSRFSLKHVFTQPFFHGPPVDPLNTWPEHISNGHMATKYSLTVLLRSKLVRTVEAGCASRRTTFNSGAALM